MKDNAGYTTFEPRLIGISKSYGLLTSMVVPRPIAFVTTKSKQGQINAAPYSYFNLMGHDPPVVAIGMGNREDLIPKDSPLNIRNTGVFVVNLVNEALAEAMNICATSFPAGVNELTVAGLTAVDGVHVDAPRIGEAPFALECRHVNTTEIGRTRVVLGEVVCFHVRDDLLDAEAMRVRTGAAKMVGRMHGGGMYTRTADLFQMARRPLSSFEGDA